MATYAYIGTFTTPERHAHGAGIYVYRVDSPTDWTLVETIEDHNPGYLAFSEDKRTIYVSHGDDVFANAYARDEATGELRLLNAVPSGGLNGAFIHISRTHACAFIAHFGSGMVSAIEFLPDGRLGKVLDIYAIPGPCGDLKIQNHPQPHQILEDPAGQYIHVCDRGTDCVYTFQFTDGHFVLRHTLDTKPAIGIRHMAFHPDGKRAYLISEHVGAIVACNYDTASGKLSAFQVVSSLPDTFMGISTGSEIAVHPSGKWLYVSNRGHNSIGQFAIDPDTGRVAPVGWEFCGGDEPRHFTFDEAGKWLYVGNEFSDNITIFRLDEETGALGKAVQQIGMKSPACILFTGPLEAKEDAT